MKTRMNLFEFKSFWDLKSKLVEARQNCLDYLLERASLGLTKSEKMAWYATYKVVRFVEEYKRFPRREELDKLLSFDFMPEEAFLQETDFWSAQEAGTIVALAKERLEIENE